MQQVYSKGEAKVVSNIIQTVVVRERGRNRRPINKTPEDAAYRGLVATSPTKVFDEIENQVAAEATPRVQNKITQLL